jgi:hypothetical protein
VGLTTPIKLSQEPYYWKRKFGFSNSPRRFSTEEERLLVVNDAVNDGITKARGSGVDYSWLFGNCRFGLLFSFCQAAAHPEA